MTTRPKTNGDAARLLTRITVDAEGDDEQLWAIAEAIASEVGLPADAFVVGEPVQVTAIDYHGDSRVGLLATCRRSDEQHVVGFADLVFSPGSDGARFSAVYRTWLGLAAPTTGRSSLHGVGVSFWRLGDLDEAAKTFTRMLWLNPSDNQGERFNLANVQAGHTWEECEA